MDSPAVKPSPNDDDDDGNPEDWIDRALSLGVWVESG